MNRTGHCNSVTISRRAEGGGTWRRRAASCMVAVALVVTASTHARPDDPEKAAGPSVTVSLPAGFTYDPQLEEGPHPDSDFEWWYHFGLLKRKGTSKYQYSFVSSFQRNKSGRYLFYNLADLDSGEKSHHALVDRSLWGLPLLPDDHEFLPLAEVPWSSSKSVLSLPYGDNRLHKQEDVYQAVYRNADFGLELTLRAAAPPMPMLGTGLTGLDQPEDQHYYSFPRMKASGLLQRGQKQWEVEGDLWYDHQWGRIVSLVPKTWGWWGLQLRDGRNLAVFFLRDGRSGAIVQKGLTLHHPDGRTEVDRDVEFQPLRYWNSPHGRRYAVEWRIESHALKCTIHLRPRSDDHELSVLLYGRIWEGPCLAEIAVPGEPTVQANGFQELIGETHEQ